MPRRPIANIEAEVTLLSACMIDYTAFARVRDVLTARNFNFVRHVPIWKAMVELSKRGTPIDMIAVVNELQVRGTLEEAGGPSYISEIAGQTYYSENIDHWAGIIKDWSLRRDLFYAATKILSKINVSAETPENPRDFAYKFANTLMRLAAEGGLDESRIIGEAIDKIIDDLEEREGAGFFYQTPVIPALRGKFKGYAPGQFIILAGRPSMGKTAYALNEAVKLAMKIPKSQVVMFFSLESSTLSLIQRMIPLITARTQTDENYWMTMDDVLDADAGQLRGLILEEDNLGMNFAGKIRSLNLVIDDTGGMKPIEISAKVSRYTARTHTIPAMVIIDYLQLIRPDTKTDKMNREQEVASISRELKAMAKEHDCPVLCLAQLNRQVEMRSPPIPRMSDLRESGSLEQDADVVMFLYRPQAYRDNPDNRIKKPDVCKWNRYGICDGIQGGFTCTEKIKIDEKIVDGRVEDILNSKGCHGVPEGASELIVGKARDGRTGTVHVAFRGEYMKFDQGVREEEIE